MWRVPCHLSHLLDLRVFFHLRSYFCLRKFENCWKRSLSTSSPALKTTKTENDLKLQQVELSYPQKSQNIYMKTTVTKANCIIVSSLKHRFSSKCAQSFTWGNLTALVITIQTRRQGRTRNKRLLSLRRWCDGG